MDSEGADQPTDIDLVTIRSSARHGGDAGTVEIEDAIASTYAAARERGVSRSEAFVRAIHLYRSHCPELPVNRAGTEVARILLKAARSEMETEIAGPAVFPRRGDMEHAESA